jgi:hypothetical protein
LVGGGQIGFNSQFAPMLVAGLEIDLQYANIGGSFGYSDPLSGFTTSSKRLLEWLGTVRVAPCKRIELSRLKWRSR